MPKASRHLVLFVISLLLSLQAAAAFAVPSPWKSVDVTLQSEQQQSMLLVSGELPPEAKLPADAELAVPAGTRLQWIGEIMGGDPSDDPELKYAKSSAGGMDIYRFTLTRSRTAQVEGMVPGVTSLDGTDYLTGLKWTAWQAVPEVRISQRIPQSARIVQAAPGASLQAGDTGYSYYTKTVKGPQAGDVIDLSFSYSLPAAGSVSVGGNTASNNGNMLIFAVIAMVAVGVFGVLAVNVNRKMAAKAALRAPKSTKSSGQAERAARVGGAMPDELDHDAETVPGATSGKKMKPIIPALIVIGVFAVGFAIAGARSTTAAVVDGRITRNFGAASACQSTSLPFTVNPGVDLAEQGELVLKGFEGMEGVGVVTLDLAQSMIEMGWCESSQSEDSMRQVVSATGLITLGQGAPPAASAPTTATMDASGKVQTAAVDTSSGSFTPGQLVLKAGVPAEISFGSAVGCLSEVIISDLGINQDLTKGPAVVQLPALQAGTYTFACAMGHQGGEIVVQ